MTDAASPRTSAAGLFLDAAGLVLAAAGLFLGALFAAGRILTDGPSSPASPSSSEAPKACLSLILSLSSGVMASSP